jgi:hypothetical protein
MEIVPGTEYVYSNDAFQNSGKSYRMGLENYTMR